MKRKLASLVLIVMSMGTAYAGGVSSTPSILNSIDEKSVKFMLTDERSATRGELFRASWGKAASTKAREWCEGRGRCTWTRGLLVAEAWDWKRWGVEYKSY